MKSLHRATAAAEHLRAGDQIMYLFPGYGREL